MPKMSFINFYQILDIERSATDDEIRKAFKRVALSYHPDKNLEDDTTEYFKVILHAYGSLMDRELRHKHDMDLMDYEPDSDDEEFVEKVRKPEGATRRTARESSRHTEAAYHTKVDGFVFVPPQIEYVHKPTEADEKWLRKQISIARALAKRKSFFLKRGARRYKLRGIPDNEDPCSEGIFPGSIEYAEEEVSSNLITSDGHSDKQLKKWERDPDDIPPQPKVNRVDKYLKYMDSRPEENIVLYEPKSKKTRRREAKTSALRTHVEHFHYIK